MAATKFAHKRRQYIQAQSAMLASESIIKSLRRELTAYVKEKAPAIIALLPEEDKRHPNALRIELADGDSRSHAAHKPFAVIIRGMSSWHKISYQEIKEIVRLMKVDGWNYVGIEETAPAGHFWTMKFN